MADLTRPRTPARKTQSVVFDIAGHEVGIGKHDGKQREDRDNRRNNDNRFCRHVSPRIFQGIIIFQLSPKVL